MKVVCTLDIGNDELHPTTKFTLEGDPLSNSGFVCVRIDDRVFEVRPDELFVALRAVRSDH